MPALTGACSGPIGNVLEDQPASEVPAKAASPVTERGIPSLAPAPAAKRARADADDRGRALGSLANLAGQFLCDSPLVLQCLADDGEVRGDSESLIAALVNKSTATLTKRASSLRAYATWFSSTGSPADAFLAEPTVYKFAKEQWENRAPPHPVLPAFWRP